MRIATNIILLLVLSQFSLAQQPATSVTEKITLDKMTLPSLDKGVQQVLCIGFRADDEITIRLGPPSVKVGRAGQKGSSPQGENVKFTYNGDSGILTIGRIKGIDGKIVVDVSLPGSASLNDPILLTTDGRPSKATMMPILLPLILSNGEIKPVNP